MRKKENINEKVGKKRNLQRKNKEKHIHNTNLHIHNI